MMPDIEKQNGVYVSENTWKNFSAFEENYIKVRDQEKRILTIEQIRQLPKTDKHYIHFKEWKIRAKSISRFLKYLSGKPKSLRILDIGCGNGFFTHKMSANNNQVVGVDVNLTELKQAAVAFPGASVKWYYLDILNEALPEEKFDIITFCASFHYFKEPEKVLGICNTLLTKGGEVHIIDSPFYTNATKVKAQESTKHYFKKMEVEDMSLYYNHHLLASLSGFNMQILYKPKPLIHKLLNLKDSPFAWIRISDIK